jgi:hypothetical protein
MVWKEPVYPDDAPKFTPEDKYRDPVALLEYREAVARRKQVDVEKARVRLCSNATGVRDACCASVYLCDQMQALQFGVGVADLRSNS